MVSLIKSCFARPSGKNQVDGLLPACFCSWVTKPAGWADLRALHGLRPKAPVRLQRTTRRSLDSLDGKCRTSELRLCIPTMSGFWSRAEELNRSELNRTNWTEWNFAEQNELIRIELNWIELHGNEFDQLCSCLHTCLSVCLHTCAILPCKKAQAL